MGVWRVHWWQGDQSACGRSARTGPRRSTDRDDVTCIRCLRWIARWNGEQQVPTRADPWSRRRAHHAVAHSE